MYIYKLGTECDGAQTQASDVYVPTLVALLGLCFDPSECFRDLCVWSGVVGNKSGKLRYVSRIMTPPHPFSHFPTSRHPCGPTFCQPGPFMACAPPRAVTPVTHRPCASASDPMLTPMTHQPRASALDPMRVRTHHNRYVWVDRAGQDQERTANRTEQFAPSDIIFDFQHMYISRRGDTVGPPVWKSIILHVFSKSELSVLEAVAV